MHLHEGKNNIYNSFTGIDYGNVELRKNRGSIVRYTCLTADADTKITNQQCRGTVGSELIHDNGHSTEGLIAIGDWIPK